MPFPSFFFSAKCIIFYYITGILQCGSYMSAPEGPPVRQPEPSDGTDGHPPPLLRESETEEGRKKIPKLVLTAQKEDIPMKQQHHPQLKLKLKSRKLRERTTENVESGGGVYGTRGRKLTTAFLQRCAGGGEDENEEDGISNSSAGEDSNDDDMGEEEDFREEGDADHGEDFIEDTSGPKSKRQRQSASSSRRPVAASPPTSRPLVHKQPKTAPSKSTSKASMLKKLSFKGK